MDLARRILALPNVDAASHSWSHPHDWTEGVDLDREIDDSVDYINSELLPMGKSVEAFLWTGMCNPTVAAVERVDSLGLANLNGGQLESVYTQKGRSRQYCNRGPSDWGLGEISRLRSAAPEMPVEKFLLDYTGSIDGYGKAIEYFERNPDRPVHVYFHWYVGVRTESLAALIRVLEWCERQPLKPVSVKDYVVGLEDKRASVSVGENGLDD